MCNSYEMSTNLNLRFVKSVHQRTIQINHQPDATIFQFIILTFVYSSTGFGRFPAHHQELNDYSGSLWFYLRIVVIVGRAVFVVGPAERRIVECKQVVHTVITGLYRVKSLL